MTSKRHLAIFGTVCLVIIVGLTVSFLSDDEDSGAGACRTELSLDAAVSLGGTLELVSETGAIVTEAEIFTRPTLLYFGYTFCPDVCPIDTVRNAEAVDILKERGFGVRPVFVSVDWVRDDAGSVADFTDNLHPDMLGLTGSEAQISLAAKAYRVYIRFEDTADPDYRIDHSTYSYLVVPGHGVLDHYRRELPPGILADRVQCNLDALGSAN